MAAPAALAVATRVPLLLERGVASTVSLPLRHGPTAALVAPSAGTWTLVTRAGVTLTSGSVTVASSIASATINPPSTADYGEGYELHWSLTIDGAAWTHRADAYIVRWVPRCACTVEDLYTRQPELRYRVPADQSDGWQRQIDAAYSELLQRLIDDGQRPWEIIGCAGYADWLITRSVQLAVEALPVGGDVAWGERTKAAAYAMRAAESRMKIQRDAAATAAERSSAWASVIRTSPARRPY